MNFEWPVIYSSMPALLKGAELTIYITVIGLIGGMATGLLFGLMRAYGNGFIRAIATLYIGLIRGTPIVVQVMFIYFALPMLISLRVDPLSAAIVTIIVNSGAYIAEIVRGSFQSVAKGLHEAGLALGLPRWRVLAFVVGPVAFRRMVPPLGNQFIFSLKDTSLLAVIGVGELTRPGTIVVATNFKAVEIYTLVAILYLMMTLSISFILRIIERKMDVS